MSIHPRPIGLPRWVLPLSACVLVGLVAALATLAFGMWFTGPDTPWLAWAAEASSPLEPGPAGSAVGGNVKPVAAAVWWSAFRLFDLWYGPYQFIHLLGWAGVLTMYAVMLRQLWGRRRRPAEAAAAMVAVTLVAYSEQILHLTHLAMTCELLLAFTSVALAAGGWRRRRMWMVMLSWLPLAGACAGSLPAAAYLVGLHVAASSWAWRRREQRVRVVAGLAMTLAIIIGCVAWTGWPTSAGSLDGAWARVRACREVLVSGPTGVLLAILAALAGLVQGIRLQFRTWPMIAALGAVMALASLTLHPLVVVGVLTLMTPAVWPFAVWVGVHQATVLGGIGVWPEAALVAPFAYVPVFAMAIWRSPLAVWIGRFGRRLDPTGRKVIYSAAALAAVLIVAHSDQWLNRHFDTLHTLSRRRRMHRELLHQIASTVPMGRHVALARYDDMHTTGEAVEASAPLQRAGIVLSFAADDYAELLAARGRADLHVVSIAELRRTGGWLGLTSTHEVEAAAEILGPLGSPQMTLSSGEIIGGLWRIEPGQSPASDEPGRATTQPAQEPASNPVE